MAYTYWPKKDSESEVIKFNIDDKSLFEVPLSQVDGCVAGKNEVSMSIRVSDDNGEKI